MNNRTYYQDNDPVNVECSNCLKNIVTTFQALEKNSLVNCEKCGFQFNCNVENLKQKYINFFEKIMGTPANNPNLN